jgi:hypothetical protein
VHAVTVVAGRGVEISGHDGAAMHALLIGLDGQRYVEHVFRGECRIRVALAAGVRQVGFADRRFWIGGRDNFVRRAVAALAGGGVAIHFGVGASVNASVVLPDFRVVAGRAKLHAARGGLGNRVLVAMAGDASGAVPGIAQHGMSACGKLRGHIVMAGDAGRGRGFRRVPIFRGAGMAIETGKILVNAVGERGGIDGDGLALRVHHPGAGTMAGKTLLRGESGSTGSKAKRQNENQISKRSKLREKF